MTLAVWKRGLGLLALVVLLSACGSGVPELPPLKEDAVVLAFGDAITAGNNVRAGENYPARLAQKLKRKVINAGLAGETTTEAVKRLPQLLQQHKPDLVIIAHGTQETTGGGDVQVQAVDNLRLMVSQAQRAGSSVALLGMPNLKHPQLAPPKLYSYIADAFEIPYHGAVVSKVLGSSNLHTEDKLPNPDGYQEIAYGVAHLLHKAKAVQLPEFEED